jgi:hypothetical protein
MSVAKEALRQQMLLRALGYPARPGLLSGWTRDGAGFTRGLQAYRANAGALAERALAAAYPVVQQLLGEDSFAALARHFWHRVPPERGDLGAWGESLADFIGSAPGLAAEPYLPDVARLEWAVHCAAGAADDLAPPAGLERLGHGDPDALLLVPRAGTTLLRSQHPVVAIWLAHRPPAAQQADRFAAVQAAFAAGRGECALVWRSGWQVQVASLEPADARFTEEILRGQSLGAAWQALGDAHGIDFERWLLAHLGRGWIGGARAPGSLPMP